MIITTTTHLPPALAKAWLQHLRDFDMANPGCHFSVRMDAPEVSISEAEDMLEITPHLGSVQIFGKLGT